MSLPLAVLDADIIFSRVLHELMGRLASSARLFDLIWSEELLNERLEKEARRRRMSPDALAGELLRTALARMAND